MATIIHNGCWGIGDAIAYSWVYHTLAASGIPVKVNPIRNHEVFRMFGVPKAALIEKSGAHPVGGPPKGKIGGPSWLESWVEYYLGRVVDPVRPPYLESSEDGEWAESRWKDRLSAFGEGPRFRVALCPEAAWAARVYPMAHWIKLGRLLEEAGCSTLSFFGSWDPKTKERGMPYAYGGLTLGQFAAMLARADLVIGNDSGPAWISGTINRPTLVVAGPSRQEVFFKEMPNVRFVKATGRDALGCEGCNFLGERGFHRGCEVQCASMMRLQPEAVLERALAMLKETSR